MWIQLGSIFISRGTGLYQSIYGAAPGRCGALQYIYYQVGQCPYHGSQSMVHRTSGTLADASTFFGCRTACLAASRYAGGFCLDRCRFVSSRGRHGRAHQLQGGHLYGRAREPLLAARLGFSGAVSTATGKVRSHSHRESVRGPHVALHYEPPMRRWSILAW